MCNNNQPTVWEMVAGGNIDSNTKIWQHQAATLPVKIALAMETKMPNTMKLRQWNKVWWSTSSVKNGDGDSNMDSNTKQWHCWWWQRQLRCKSWKKDTTMETVKAQQSTCGVKDDDIGSIDSNLSNSNTMQRHYWQWQTSSGNQYTKQQGPTQQCRLDCNSTCLQSLYSGHSWGWAVTTMATAASDRMNIVSLKKINCQQQQQHNCMPSNAGSVTTLRPSMWRQCQH